MVCVNDTTTVGKQVGKLLMCIAGGLGIPGTRKERSTSRNAFAGVFMGFSITSTVLGGIIIICYSQAIGKLRVRWTNRVLRYDHLSPSYRRLYTNEMVISAIILILGIVEFVIGIWVSVCLCKMKPHCYTCCYGNTPQQGQAMYTANVGYVMTQGPGGVPVAVPMQAVGVQTVTPSEQGSQPQMVMVPVTPGAQGGQPQMVFVPVSGAEVYQPQLIQVPGAGAVATGYQLQQVEMPPPYEQGQYITQYSGQMAART
ncbi:hypothetical protein ACROYT_G029904 [Oculina patagonica]